MFLKLRFLVKCFIILFQIKRVKPSVTGQNHSKYLHFYGLKDIFVVLQPYIILGVFHYFGHHRRPASQIFNLRPSFNYLNPANIFIPKKLRFGHFKVWFGMKAAKIGYSSLFNFLLGP